MPKMARTQQRVWMRQQLKRQGGLCPLCAKVIDLSIPREGVIDHDHETGECRGVLHRSCNAAEGKVRNAAGRWGAKSTKDEALIPWLRNLVAYLEAPGCGIIYSQHQTAEEKRLAALAKQRRARATRTARKQVRSMKTTEVTTNE